MQRIKDGKLFPTSFPLRRSLLKQQPGSLRQPERRSGTAKGPRRCREELPGLEQVPLGPAGLTAALPARSLLGDELPGWKKPSFHARASWFLRGSRGCPLSQPGPVPGDRLRRPRRGSPDAAHPEEPHPGRLPRRQTWAPKGSSRSPAPPRHSHVPARRPPRVPYLHRRPGDAEELPAPRSPHRAPAAGRAQGRPAARTAAARGAAPCGAAPCRAVLPAAAAGRPPPAECAVSRWTGSSRELLLLPPSSSRLLLLFLRLRAPGSDTPAAARQPRSARWGRGGAAERGAGGIAERLGWGTPRTGLRRAWTAAPGPSQQLRSEMGSPGCSEVPSLSPRLSPQHWLRFPLQQPGQQLHDNLTISPTTA